MLLSFWLSLLFVLYEDLILCLDQQPATVARGTILTIMTLCGLDFSPGGDISGLISHSWGLLDAWFLAACQMREMCSTE
jgi:hypothetical protein